MSRAIFPIDDHSAHVDPAVCALYAEAIVRFGPVPTLIESDTNLPELAVLIEETERADAILSAARGRLKERSEHTDTPMRPIGVSKTGNSSPALTLSDSRRPPLMSAR